MHERCCTCAAAREGQVKVTPDIDLGSMKYKGSLIFGSGICIQDHFGKSSAVTLDFGLTVNS